LIVRVIDISGIVDHRHNSKKKSLKIPKG